MSRTALFAGSFDPYTVGHHSIVERALALFDSVVIAVGCNMEKQCLSAADERVAAIERLYAGDSRVRVVTYSTLTMDLAREVGATALLIPRDTEDRIARHEVGLTPEDIAGAASRLLRCGGRFCVIYPAPRAFEMMCAMQAARLAPKRIRTIHGVEGRAPKLVLMDAVKDGGSMLHWLEPLVLQKPDGSYTDEWRRIYRMEENG